MQRSRLVTFELMVREDANSVRPNNYVGSDGGALSATDDTSRFDLRIDDVPQSIEVVAFQVVENGTDASLLPEYICVEDTAVKTPHTVINSSGNGLDNVFAVMSSQSNFQKTFGRLSTPVVLQRGVKVRTLRIRLHEADGSPFNLANAFTPSAESPLKFNAFLTVKLTSFAR